MDWTKYAALSEEWTRATLDYVSAINAFVARGMRDGWDAAGPEPGDARTPELARRVVDVVREANATGEWRELRGRFPVAHRPFASFLDDVAIGIHTLAWIDDDRVAARLGPSWDADQACVVVFGRAGETEVLPDVLGTGRMGELLAVAYPDRVELLGRWGAPPFRTVPMPGGLEGVPAHPGVELEPPDGVWFESVQPLPDGSGALVTLHEGVFVCTEAGVQRRFPEVAALEQELARAAEDEGTLRLRYDMIHATLSPDGALIACGSQDSQHLLLRTADGVAVARFGPVHSSYPHHGAFSADGSQVAFNSCHFYNGVTVGGSVEALRGLLIDEYVEDDRLPVIDDVLRVYASDWVDGVFALGGAHGYVHGVTPAGEQRWRHFVGSTIGGVAVAPDGRTLAVVTAAGFLVLLDTQPTERDPTLIGTAGFRELIRYVCWQAESIWRW